MVLAAFFAGAAVTLLLVQAAGQEEVSPTITEVLQKRVSINVEDGTPVEVWDAAFRAWSQAALSMGGMTFKGSPGMSPEYRGERNRRVTLVVEDIRVGDLMRLVAALNGCDVYITGQREIVMAATDSEREVKGVQLLPPLSAADY